MWQGFAKAAVWFSLVVPAVQQPVSVPSSIQKLRLLEDSGESEARSAPETVSDSGGGGSGDADGPCRLWLAPSHTGTDKEPKYGLFAGIDYNQNDTIPNSELGIPLVCLICCLFGYRCLCVVGAGSGGRWSYFLYRVELLLFSSSESKFLRLHMLLLSLCFFLFHLYR